MQLTDAFFPLFVAHLIGDFILQTEQMALKKGSHWRWLVRHATELGVITLICCWTLKVWPVAIVVFLTHVIFDWIKPRLPGSPLRWYLADQAAHVVILLFCARWIRDESGMLQMPLAPYVPLPVQAIIAAYIVVARPLTVTIGLFLKPWRDEVLKVNGNGPANDSITGLTRSGEWVGNFERFLVLTCVLVGQYSLIGAILVTKAIMRFGDISRSQQRRRADYAIIGTLASVGLAVAVGLLTLQVNGTASLLR